MIDQTPFSHVTKEPRLYGVVDVLRVDRVAGWVMDRTDAAQCATVEIRREDQLVGTVTANRPRKDLERQEVGTGCYGFAFTFDPPLDEGMECTVAVTARSHDGVKLVLQPVAGAAKTVSAEKRMLCRILAHLARLRADVDSLAQDMAAASTSHSRSQEQLELVQLRLERGMSAVDIPRNDRAGWLVWIAAGGFIMAAGSLVIALLSFWAA